MHVLKQIWHPSSRGPGTWSTRSVQTNCTSSARMKHDDPPFFRICPHPGLGFRPYPKLPYPQIQTPIVKRITCCAECGLNNPLTTTRELIAHVNLRSGLRLRNHEGQQQQPTARRLIMCRVSKVSMLQARMSRNPANHSQVQNQMRQASRMYTNSNAAHSLPRFLLAGCFPAKPAFAADVVTFAPQVVIFFVDSPDPNLICTTMNQGRWSPRRAPKAKSGFSVRVELSYFNIKGSAISGLSQQRSRT